jgi:hypothetical protein
MLSRTDVLAHYSMVMGRWGTRLMASMAGERPIDAISMHEPVFIYGSDPPTL